MHESYGVTITNLRYSVIEMKWGRQLTSNTLYRIYVIAIEDTDGHRERQAPDNRYYMYLWEVVSIVKCWFWKSS